MKTILGYAASVSLLLAGASQADGFYNLLDEYGTQVGEISFAEVVGNDTVWVWPTEEGDVVFFIENTLGNQGDWSEGSYWGYFTTDLPVEIDPPCPGSPIFDAYGNASNQWGDARIDWTRADSFMLSTKPCGAEPGLTLHAAYAWGEAATERLPVSVTLALQSDVIPLSYDDPTYTEQGLDKNPAIYLDVTFDDGSTEDHDYKKFEAHNIVFDDISGDPNDLIEINYWDVDSDNPGLGKYAAQLTSTGKGTGTAELRVWFVNAPNVTASVLATVVSAVEQQKVPVNVSLELQSDTLPLSRQDTAYTVSQLDLFPAIYVSVSFADGSSFHYDYHKDFAENVVVDDVSGDPYDLIEVVMWDVDNNDIALGKFAGQLTATGNGVGTAYLGVSFRNAPGVTASIPVNVVSGTQ